MSGREKSEMETEDAKETDTRTESTSMEETEGQDTDLCTSEAGDRTDWRRKRDHPRDNATQMRHELDQSSGHPVRTGVADCQYYLLSGRCFFGRSCRYNHPPRNQMGDDTVQPSAYQVRLGAKDCEQYLQTGQCSYGLKCWFNHPPLTERNQMRHEMVQPSPYPGARDCEQYLQKGQCSYGRRCRFNHPPAPVLPERVSRPFCKATTWFRRSDEMRHGTESSFMALAEKRARCNPRERFQDVSDDVVAGQNTWLQRRRAQENMQRGNESEEERTLRERQAHDLEEQKVEGKWRVYQIKSTVQSSEGGIQKEQRLEIPENPQEQADMERQNREAQDKAQEERSRSLTDNVDQLGQFLQVIGFERKEGDGF
ncbi:zinc finger CCCH domain-containing protein 43-like [Raphanus sativus]|nr:zinc finger CCCH domain-containing protein 43-like [Raphanus sativus]